MIKRFIASLTGTELPPPIEPPPSNPDRFWALIEQSRRPDLDDQLKALHEVLSGLTRDELIAFEADYRRVHRASYRRDLWGAFYAMNGGCSDDGFDYARDWLISRGRAVHDAMLVDPDGLVDHLQEGDDAGFEEFGYVAQEVFEERFDEDMPELDFPPLGPPQGDDWEEEDVPKMFPRLTAWEAAQ